MTQKFNLLGIHTYGDLLKALQRGWKLCSIEEFRDGTKGLNTRVSADANYIRWSNYGSSVNKATARDMEFVVTQIFESNLDEFIRRFIWA